ncbi:MULTISPECIES: AI-2E family transporter [Thioclava]|uniref:AI-2E family transporter n=1 Tax=Thioclava TaxID=285107 RepID=UPI00098A7906|nr:MULTISPECIES: AI-2E family transporter [Thioclava]OWY01937.1 AI-2E family transporter [Thioclava sp. F1Mire-8]OWY17530.1 AI-2E family transporter [Thioclava sp. JM3]WGT49684.1 AI-2E family transporter [Thioclava nitratireducens]
MALPARQQVTYWSVAALVLVLSLWWLGNVILPFIMGGAIAYFLDPLADRLEKLGLSRAASTAIIGLVTVLIFVILALAVVPMLARQLAQLVALAPDLLSSLQAFLNERFPNLLQNSVVNDTLNSLGSAIKARGGELAATLLSSAMTLVNVVVFIVVVPVVAFYMLLDWDRMVAKIDGWLPRDHVQTIRTIARDIDRVLSGFVRGQVTVCLVLGGFYAIALMAAGLDFGLLVGSVAGALTFIPYIGAIIGGTLAIGLALFQFWGEWFNIGIVAGIFVLGQFLEGNFVTPKLVGDSVGLHPLWLIFALSAFGTLFGFVGMLVAVPVAAVIGVVARFFIDQYLQGALYRGQTEREPTAHPPISLINEETGEVTGATETTEHEN